MSAIDTLQCEILVPTSCGMECVCLHSPNPLQSLLTKPIANYLVWLRCVASANCRAHWTSSPPRSSPTVSADLPTSSSRLNASSSVHPHSRCSRTPSPFSARGPAHHHPQPRHRGPRSCARKWRSIDWVSGNCGHRLPHSTLLPSSARYFPWLLAGPN